MGKVLGIVYRTIATHLTHKAGYTLCCCIAQTQQGLDLSGDRNWLRKGR